MIKRYRSRSGSVLAAIIYIGNLDDGLSQKPHSKVARIDYVTIYLILQVKQIKRGILHCSTTINR